MVYFKIIKIKRKIKLNSNKIKNSEDQELNKKI